MSNHTYKQIVLTGTSKNGIEDAVTNALAKAAESVRNLRWFQITETRGHIENQKVSHWQVTMTVGFTLED
jgi:flavin-binding protein dodecin